MTTFSYSAGTKTGNTVKGTIVANDIMGGVGNLRDQGLYIFHIGRTGQFGPIDIEAIKLWLSSLMGAEMGSVERLMFTQHLSSMLKTGVPMVEAVQTFQETGGNSRKQKMLAGIIDDIEAGVTLSQAFAKYPKTFSPIYTNIVSSGESMGTLGDTLGYLADQLHRDQDLLGRVKGALIYPVVILCIMGIVLGFLMFTVVPKLLEFVQNIGSDLPQSTKILIAITSIFTHYGLFLGIGGIGLVFLFTRVIRTKRGREYFDTVMLSLPLIGMLNKKFNIARFARLLGAFYHNGIALPTAFSILQTSLPNIHYQQAVARLGDAMAHGVSLSEALEHENEQYFPKIICRVVRSAEKTATVDESLWRLADYYEGELDGTLKNLTTIIEPILILVLGVAVLGIAVAVVVPIYQVTTNIK